METTTALVTDNITFFKFRYTKSPPRHDRSFPTRIHIWPFRLRTKLTHRPPIDSPPPQVKLKHATLIPRAKFSRALPRYYTIAMRDNKTIKLPCALRISHSNCTIVYHTIRGLRPVVQVRDAYCCSRRFSVVRCETSPVQIKGLILVLPKSTFTINVQTIKPF